MRTQWIEINGKRILDCDLSYLSPDQFISEYNGATELLLSQDGPVPVLIDFTGTTADERGLRFIKSEEARKASLFVQRAAVVGVTGIKRVIYNIFHQLSSYPTQDFSTKEEGLAWLLEQD